MHAGRRVSAQKAVSASTPFITLWRSRRRANAGTLGHRDFPSRCQVPESLTEKSYRGGDITTAGRWGPGPISCVASPSLVRGRSCAMTDHVSRTTSRADLQFSVHRFGCRKTSSPRAPSALCSTYPICSSFGSPQKWITGFHCASLVAAASNARSSDAFGPTLISGGAPRCARE